MHSLPGRIMRVLNVLFHLILMNNVPKYVTITSSPFCGRIIDRLQRLTILSKVTYSYNAAVLKSKLKKEGGTEEELRNADISRGPVGHLCSSSALPSHKLLANTSCHWSYFSPSFCYHCFSSSHLCVLTRCLQLSLNRFPDTSLSLI